MSYEYIKALHLIFIVTWFAGLFYIVRLFIYHTEAQEKTEPEKTVLTKQFIIMERRLWYGITLPSAIATLVLGLTLSTQFWPYTEHPWLMAKLGFIIGLFGYNHACGIILKRLWAGDFKYSSNFLRIWNEVATLFLFAIVFLAILKDSLAFIPAIIGLVIFAFVLMAAIRIYKKLRTR